MYKNYLHTFEGLLSAQFTTQHRITSQELTFIEQCITESLQNESTFASTATILSASPKYVLKYILCALAERDGVFQSYQEFADWVAPVFFELSLLEHSEIESINFLFEFNGVEAFTRRFNRYVEQLAKAVINGVQRASKTHLRVLKLTLLHVKQQVDRGSSEELDNFLFMMHYREISLDLDFLMGATDVLSNRLSAHLKNQQEDV